MPLEATQPCQSINYNSSSIHTLPIELVQEIFLRCIPSDPLEFILPDIKEAPLLLTQVSSGWRALAISTPGLWVSLSLNHPREPHREMSLILTWLSRAGALPLRLAVCGAVWENHLTTVLLNSFSSRSSHVRFCLHEEGPTIFWDSNIHPVELSELRSLELRSPYGLEKLTIDRLASALRTATKLRHLSWSNGGSGLPVHDISWAHLTRISISADITESECMHMFQELYNIQHLVLSLDIPSCAPAKPIHLPHLALLSFSIGRDCRQFLGSLVLPSLCQLGITGGFASDMSWFAQCFRGLVERSSCSLISLNLYWMTLSEEDLFSCIRCTHTTLKELTLKVSVAVTDRVLSTLSNEPDSPSHCLCPKLEVLAIYGEIGCSPGALARMVKTRLKHPVVPEDDPSFVARLRVMEISSKHSEIPSLAPLRSDGLLLRIYGYENRLEMPDGSEDLQENEAAFQKLLAEGLTWFAYPAIDDFEGHLA